MLQKQQSQINQQNHFSNDPFSKRPNQQHESKQLYLDANLSEEKANELRQNYVVPLTADSKRSNTAKYRCFICNYFCHTLDAALKHKSNKFHAKNSQAYKTDSKLKELLVPFKENLDKLDSYLYKIYASNHVNQTEIDKRFDFFLKFKSSFLSQFPEAKVNLYGSTASGFCFKDSMIDVDVQIDNKGSIDVLQLISKFLVDPINSDFIDLQSINNNSGDKVTCKLKNDNVHLQLTSCHFLNSYRTNRLFNFYSKLDKRFKVLAFCFRYMAKITRTDKVELNTLPAHAFIIMAIYFLQNVDKRVLPCLNEVILDGSLSNDGSLSVENSSFNYGLFEAKVESYVNEKYWKSENTDSIGLLWLKMLSYYSKDTIFRNIHLSIRSSKTVNKSEWKYFGRKLAIEDPFIVKQNICKNLLTQTNDYLFTNNLKAVVYFTNKTNHISGSQLSNGRLKLIETMAQEMRVRLSDYLSINSSEDEQHKEDLLSRQLSKRSISECSNGVVDQQRKEKAVSLSIDFNSMSNEVGDIIEKMNDLNAKNIDINEEEDELDEDEEFDDDDAAEQEEDVDDGDEETDGGCSDDGIEIQTRECLDKIIDRVENLDKSFVTMKQFVPIQTVDGIPEIPFVESIFKFDSVTLSCDKGPPLVCTLCDKEGHLCKECPQDTLPELHSLPQLTDSWIEILTKTCIKVMEDSQQNKEEERIRNELLDALYCIIKVKYPDVHLELFGSSNNGFGMKKSDLDICMTFKSHPLGEKLLIDYKDIINNVATLLKVNRDFESIEVRASAKVPIVKFLFKRYKIEGDISIYNSLALHNTELLRAYTRIDPRIKPLGHVVKHFAKICRIGDASCGSLSSYAYIILLIHYLMQAEPAVLPCLQKIGTDKDGKKKVLIDGWDCWFYRDIDNLLHIWDGYKKNTQSVGELWLGFLRYYTEIFDWKNCVVSIRDTSLLSRKAKGWNKTRLAIEDPFELSHNLAAGVSPRMGLYILKAMRKARAHFGTPTNELRPNEVGLNSEYFFNYKTLVDGSPPMDRNCFLCSKIGHMTKECPNADFIKNNKKLSRHRNRNKEPSDVTVTSKCYNCNKFGHLARDCTETKGGGHMKCFKCNQNGHLGKDCQAMSKQNAPQAKAPTQSNQKPPQYYNTALSPIPISDMESSFSNRNKQQQPPKQQPSQKHTVYQQQYQQQKHCPQANMYYTAPAPNNHHGYQVFYNSNYNSTNHSAAAYNNYYNRMSRYSQQQQQQQHQQQQEWPQKPKYQN